MREEIAFLAGPRDWGVTRESWLARIPVKVPTVTFRTVKSLWYGEIKDENHWAAREIKRAAQLLKAQKEAKKYADQYQAIANGLNAIDPDFHSERIAAYLDMVRQLRTKDSA